MCSNCSGLQCALGIRTRDENESFSFYSEQQWVLSWLGIYWIKRPKSTNENESCSLVTRSSTSSFDKTGAGKLCRILAREGDPRDWQLRVGEPQPQSSGPSRRTDLDSTSRSLRPVPLQLDAIDKLHCQLFHFCNWPLRHPFTEIWRRRFTTRTSLWVDIFLINFVEKKITQTHNSQS